MLAIQALQLLFFWEIAYLLDRMNNSSDNLICRHTFNAQQLVDSHPEKIRNANKKIVYRIACPPNSIHQGEIVFSRWRSIELAEISPSLTDRIEVQEQKSYFEYPRSQHRGRLVEWYLNFAHLEIVSPIVSIHTGFWRCGAYGGNRILMALLQLLAARLAQIDKLVFHTTDDAGAKALATARSIIDRELVIAEASIPQILDKIYAKAFKWGIGDGN